MRKYLSPSHTCPFYVDRVLIFYYRQKSAPGIGLCGMLPDKPRQNRILSGAENLKCLIFRRPDGPCRLVCGGLRQFYREEFRDSTANFLLNFLNC